VKVIAAPFTALQRYVSREFWTTLMLLVWEYRWRRIETNALSSNDALDVLQRRLGGMPDVLLVWESYAEVVRHAAALKRAGTRIYVITDDLHGNRGCMSEAISAADGILSTYAPRLREFFPDHDESRVTWVPHAAGPDFMLPVCESPRRSIFLSGAMSNYYPLRLRMRALARTRPDLVTLHDHPGYWCVFDYASDQRVGRGYAEAMQKHIAAFTDASVCVYLLAKHFEIPATGTLLIADRAAADQLRLQGFIDGEHYVSSSADDLEDVVHWVLDPSNNDSVDAMRRRGHALVRERHTTFHRATQINDTCV